MEKKYSVFQVAKWFLSKESMTHKRLQKLCYYAEAWYYTLKNQELTNENFQAWRHGPVSLSLYNEFKNNGWSEISVSCLEKYEDINDVDDVDFLESVWNTYEHLGANSLEVLTHREKPWKSAYNPNCEGYCTRIISKESMKEYYIGIYKSNNESEY